ncbi:protein adenylyltransferase SelO-like [Achroia grisella]|uniref:protein adenylyltransferase SelO-like n=1 Tax=Achroia grisella TaxID=688607 RepID=UPI0027D2DC5B|nr:protein adenylyltransferase SelO-like [Achroia grisella]
MRRALCTLTTVRSEYKNMSGQSAISNFKEWKFKGRPIYAELPINEHPIIEDPENITPYAVRNAVFSKVPTNPLIDKVQLVCSSHDALTEILDLDPAVEDSEEFVKFVAGKYLPAGGYTVCHRYGGYQFGLWADQLGDGRAHILGEYVNRKGESWQPQLKGSGETPYSRFGDGRAVLRSSIREMIASEACYFLGIPTTRAAALVVSEPKKVWRDKFYTGNAQLESTAIVLRLAPAWYRLGSIEILDKMREPKIMKTLVDHIIKNYFPNIRDDEDKYVNWYTEVAHRNIDMVAAWQGFGFTHGVLNTDNVSVLGLTIDYGPYGFIEHYHRHYVPNTSDDMARYAYCQQPEIILWNLKKFAAALEPILTDIQRRKIQQVRNTLDQYANDKILQTYVYKLGLNEVQDGDVNLVDELLQLMQNTMADFTATFRQLAEVPANKLLVKSVLDGKWSLNKIHEAPQWAVWVTKYRNRLKAENVSEELRSARMLKVNPLYVPKNWIMEEAIADAEKNDFEKVRFLLKVFRNPFEVNEKAERCGYSAHPPSWSYGVKLSCSS